VQWETEEVCEEGGSGHWRRVTCCYVRGALGEIGRSRVVVVYHEGADFGIRDEWRTLAAALVEDEEVGRVVGFHESTLKRAVDCVAFAQQMDVD
jgi:hypothetical protein